MALDSFRAAYYVDQLALKSRRAGHRWHHFALKTGSFLPEEEWGALFLRYRSPGGQSDLAEMPGMSVGWALLGLNGTL